MSGSITPQKLSIVRPDDWHLHLRDGAAMQSVVADSARQFARAIIMPNLKPPVLTTADALAYRQRIMTALGQQDPAMPVGFKPLMTLYLTDNTKPDEVQRASASGFVYAIKLYPAGATTNSQDGVTDLLGNCSAVLEAMQRCGMPLLIHGEVTDPEVDVFDREAVFIERVLIPLRQAFPELKIVLEHITTAQGAAYVSEAAGPIAATITPQHLLYNRNAIFHNGLRPHWYCLPILKRETHRQALLRAACSTSGRFFLGTDSAPHARGAKEQDCGCAGCYTARHALAMYATAFEQAGCLDRLEAFASLNGPAFYGLPVNVERISLQRKEQVIESELAYADETLVPLAAGHSLPWSLL